MAKPFKRNAIHLSNLLGRDKAVVEDAQLKLEVNHDAMQSEITRSYVQEPLDDVFYAGHCFGGFVGLYIDGVGYQVFVVYLYLFLYIYVLMSSKIVFFT